MSEIKHSAEPEPADESIQLDSESVEAEKSHEEIPMIDVHAPHGGVHTWKDFWIHLGTITLGLLIAIGLEQSAEWVHHRSERHQLEADLRAEGERNRVVVVGDLQNGAARRARLLALRDEADRMRDSGGKLKLPYIPEPTVDPKTNQPVPPQVLPSDAAWATAKESELVGLLPRPEAEVYSRLELQHEFLADSVKAFLQAQQAVRAFETRFEDGSARSPDLGRMNAAQLDEYSVLLSREISAADDLNYRLKNFDSESDAILRGAKTEEEMIRQALERMGTH